MVRLSHNATRRSSRPLLLDGQRFQGRQFMSPHLKSSLRRLNPPSTRRRVKKPHTVLEKIPRAPAIQPPAGPETINAIAETNRFMPRVLSTDRTILRTSISQSSPRPQPQATASASSRPAADHANAASFTSPSASWRGVFLHLILLAGDGVETFDVPAQPVLVTLTSLESESNARSAGRDRRLWLLPLRYRRQFASWPRRRAAIADECRNGVRCSPETV